MKIAFVFFTLNAERNCDWEAALFAVEKQSLQPDLRLLVDSESGDKTVELARQKSWEIYPVKRKDFNHGKTRDMIMRYLNSRGYDVAVFASQDIIPAVPDSIKKLIVFLSTHSVSAVYGRQISHHGLRSLSRWQRNRCYAAESCVKSKADIPAQGLMTPFCSNAFSAWKIKETLAYGGFPQTDFGEDMLAAAKIILNGGSIGYCADATCFHDHSERWSSLFHRGFQIGRMHARNPWLVENFGSLRQCGKRVSIPKHIIPPLTVKYAGFLFGKFTMQWKWPLSIFVLMWLLLLPMIFVADIPFPDVATRYAPMAEAFSVGNWEFAFHPRIPPVFPALAGCIAYILQTDGFLACKVASAMMLCLGVFPLWGAVKNIYGERHAITAICLYCGCSYLLRLGYGGIRETTSCFGILISYYGMSQLYRNKNSLTGLVCFACGSSILLLNRGDLILFLFFSGIILFVWDICKHIIPWRMVLTAAIIFLSIFPWLCYNYIQIGYPVTDVRHAAAIRFMERKCKFVFPCNPNPRMKLDINMPGMEGAPHE